jgi:hypothetical protein
VETPNEREADQTAQFRSRRVLPRREAPMSDGNRKWQGNKGQVKWRTIHRHVVTQISVGT